MPVYNEEKYLRDSIDSILNQMFIKECIEKNGLYRDKIGPAEDYDLWFRISEFFNLANIPIFQNYGCILYLNLWNKFSLRHEYDNRKDKHVYEVLSEILED